MSIRKRSIIATARALGYWRVMPDIAERLAAASSSVEEERVMVSARHAMSDRDRKLWSSSARTF